MHLLSSFNLLALLLTILFLNPTTFAQETNNNKIKTLSCIDDKKDFRIQGPDTDELKMIYVSHMKFFHNRTLTEEEIDSLMNTQMERSINTELKSIVCPDKDGFAIYSADEKELLFWMGDHLKIVHDQEYSDKDFQATQKLKITIEPIGNEFIKGQLFDVIVRVKNESTDTIRFKPGSADQSLFSYNESKAITYKHPSYMETSGFNIAPNEEFVQFLSPLKFINHKEQDKGILPGSPWFYWPEGNYDYYITYKLDNELIESNKVPISIKPVPDSLLTAFEQLKSYYPFDSDTIENAMELYKKYKDTFYDKEYLYSLLSYKFYEVLYGNQESEFVKYFKDFVLKYPNTSESFLYLTNFSGFRSTVFNNLMDSLITRDDAQLLKMVISNQKLYQLKGLKNY